MLSPRSIIARLVFLFLFSIHSSVAHASLFRNIAHYLEQEAVPKNEELPTTKPFDNTGEHSIPIVLIGDPGNEADPETGYGAVKEEFSIGLHDVTVEEYCEFLNAVASDDDPFMLYHSLMSSDETVKCIELVIENTKTIYKPILGREKFPMPHVSCCAGKRYCNWLQNGKPHGHQGITTTEKGSYDLTLGIMVEKGANAVWFLPTKDQLYKATFYKGGSANAGYYKYPNRSDTELPDNSYSNWKGDNQANYKKSCWDYSWWWSYSLHHTMSKPPYLTPVEYFENSRSPYGLFDTAGNIAQWTATEGPSANNQLTVIVFGSSWDATIDQLEKGYSQAVAPGTISNTIGFRVATSLNTGRIAPFSSDSPAARQQREWSTEEFVGTVGMIALMVLDPGAAKAEDKVAKNGSKSGTPGKSDPWNSYNHIEQNRGAGFGGHGRTTRFGAHSPYQGCSNRQSSDDSKLDDGKSDDSKSDDGKVDLGEVFARIDHKQESKKADPSSTAIGLEGGETKEEVHKPIGAHSSQDLHPDLSDLASARAKKTFLKEEIQNTQKLIEALHNEERLALIEAFHNEERLALIKALRDEQQLADLKRFKDRLEEELESIQIKCPSKYDEFDESDRFDEGISEFYEMLFERITLPLKTPQRPLILNELSLMEELKKFQTPDEIPSPKEPVRSTTIKRVRSCDWFESYGGPDHPSPDLTCSFNSAEAEGLDTFYNSSKKSRNRVRDRDDNSSEADSSDPSNFEDQNPMSDKEVKTPTFHGTSRKDLYNSAAKRLNIPCGIVAQRAESIIGQFKNRRGGDIHRAKRPTQRRSKKPLSKSNNELLFETNMLTERDPAKLNPETTPPDIGSN